jgi:hypothetical protein
LFPIPVPNPIPIPISGVFHIPNEYSFSGKSRVVCPLYAMVKNASREFFFSGVRQFSKDVTVIT